MIKKSISTITAMCMLLFSVCPIWAADHKKETRAERVIDRLDEDAWGIVDVRRVSGTRIVLSQRVGAQIDLEESNRYALFQGATVYSQKIDLPVLRLGVSGFQSAEFMKRDNGKLAIKIRYRSGPRIETRLVDLRSENDLHRLRDYIEHFDEIIKGEYALADTATTDAAYPQYTEDAIDFEERKTRFRVETRFPGMLTLKNGKQIKGEFLPMYEDRRILIETDLQVEKVAVADIREVRFFGRRGSGCDGTGYLIGNRRRGHGRGDRRPRRMAGQCRCQRDDALGRRDFWHFRFRDRAGNRRESHAKQRDLYPRPGHRR